MKSLRPCVGLALLATVTPQIASAQALQPPPPYFPQPPTTPPYSPQPGPPGTGYSGAAPPPQGARPNAAADRYDREQATATEEDSGRGLEIFYVNAGLGFSALGLQTLSSTNLGFQKTAGVGPELDLGVGIRLLFLTAGPRVRFHALSGFDLWQIGAEIGFHVPTGRLDPYVAISGGYAFASSVTPDAIPSSATTSVSDVRLRGGAGGVEGGLDYYLSKQVSIGGTVGGQLLFLSRPALQTTADATFSVGGSSVGANLLLQVHAGLHL